MHRRIFLQNSGKGVLGLALTRVLAACGASDLESDPGKANDALRASRPPGGYGPLVQTGPELMLPAGFRYVSFGAAGTPMSDGHPTPGAHDGMAVFSGDRNQLRLVRNHELSRAEKRLRSRRCYDPSGGGCVTLSVWDPRTEALVESYMALRGTIENCSGGATPRRTWLTCEESTEGLEEGFERPHGYVFEVSAHAAREVEAEPLVAMGRFAHEAAVTDPDSGIVYMTEDNGDPGDGFYRFLPKHRRRLREGGRLQMLAIVGQPGYDTSTGHLPGTSFDTCWVDIDEPDPADAEQRPDAVYAQGIAKGAANFLGLEGAFCDGGSIYFTASEAGAADQGQVWRYTPHGDDEGELTLLYESVDGAVLNQPDGLIVSPRGGILLCEDGDGEDVDGGDNFLRGLAPDGRLFDFAKNTTPLDLHAFDPDEFPQPGPIGASEFAGATFSPDGKWLFVNLQYPGITVAITGPWHRGCL